MLVHVDKYFLTYHLISYIMSVVKLNIVMTVTTEDGGRQNMFAKEPQMYITEEDMKRYEEVTYAERAERINGWAAMLGIVAAFGAYAFSGQIIPGVW